jgi:hypothetical protein
MVIDDKVKMARCSDVSVSACQQVPTLINFLRYLTLGRKALPSTGRSWSGRSQSLRVLDVRSGLLDLLERYYWRWDRLI